LRACRCSIGGNSPTAVRGRRRHRSLEVGYVRAPCRGRCPRGRRVRWDQEHSGSQASHSRHHLAQTSSRVREQGPLRRLLRYVHDSGRDTGKASIWHGYAQNYDAFSHPRQARYKAAERSLGRPIEGCGKRAGRSWSHLAEGGHLGSGPALGRPLGSLSLPPGVRPGFWGFSFWSRTGKLEWHRSVRTSTEPSRSSGSSRARKLAVALTRASE
jgi:hypothetical protein